MATTWGEFTYMFAEVLSRHLTPAQIELFNEDFAETFEKFMEEQNE